MITLNRVKNGKIARLPQAVRDALNRRLDDGEGGEKILAWLNELPEVQEILRTEFGGKPIVRQNLWAWRHGGYRDWLMRQEMMELAQRFAQEPEAIAAKSADGGASGSAKGDRPPMTETMALWITAQFGVASRYLLAAQGKKR